MVDISSPTFASEIRGALDYSLSTDPDVLVFGLGVPDPKGVFGTTSGLQDRHGAQRVFDIPTSENGMTGIAIGAALNGKRPILTHQRLDFALLSLDQIVNNAAKWHFMFGGGQSVPITIRMIIGRGWGQGPTHSQNLQSWFSHVPGLKVVMPSLAEDARQLLLSSIYDPNPVIFLEHRWLHNLKAEKEADNVCVDLSKAKLISQGCDLTIISSGYMTIEAIHAIKVLSSAGIEVDHVDLRSLNPIDYKTIFASVRKTKRAIILDSGTRQLSIASEISTNIVEHLWINLKAPPVRLTSPNYNESTSFGLTKDYHVRANDIISKSLELLGLSEKSAELRIANNGKHDVPGEWFSGPF